jgi:hypothetical protein
MITSACHALLPLYNLQAVAPETALRLFQGWQPVVVLLPPWIPHALRTGFHLALETFRVRH